MPNNDVTVMTIRGVPRDTAQSLARGAAVRGMRIGEYLERLVRLHSYMCAMSVGSAGLSGIEISDQITIAGLLRDMRLEPQVN